MATPQLQVPSPSPSIADPEDVVASNHKAITSKKSNMLNIKALLNPSVVNDSKLSGGALSASPPPTPASTPATTFSASSEPNTPNTMASSKRQRTDNGKMIFFPPLEGTKHVGSLSNADQKELARQHDRFQVLPPSGNKKDSIEDFSRHIPYSSSKKTFGGKTGKDGFNVFQYSFVVPQSSTKHTVMWDYGDGLVRITPFFKACGYAKTTPAKALTTNAGLKDLSHSITGGSLNAQGYWMPYWCARALCRTFCHEIRWVLTPVFGPSFIHDCLTKDDPQFGRFKIDAAIMMKAQQEADRVNTPSPSGIEGRRSIPKSVPEDASLVAGNKPSRLAKRPTFKFDSPFASTDGAGAAKSPEISPKSSYSGSSWTSINGPLIPDAQNLALQNSLLNTPNHGSWRPAVQTDVTQKDMKSTTTRLPLAKDKDSTSTTKKKPSTHIVKKMHSTSAAKYKTSTIVNKRKPSTTKRRRSWTKRTKRNDDNVQSASSYDDNASSSEEDDQDIIIPDSARRFGKPSGNTASAPSTASATPNASGTPTTPATPTTAATPALPATPTAPATPEITAATAPGYLTPGGQNRRWTDKDITGAANLMLLKMQGA